MKCPHCSADIGLFSPEMSALGQSKTCPACGQPARLGLRRGRFAIGVAAVAVASVMLGLGGVAAAGLAGAVGAIAGLGLLPGRT